MIEEHVRNLLSTFVRYRIVNFEMAPADRRSQTTLQDQIFTENLANPPTDLQDTFVAFPAHVVHDVFGGSRIDASVQAEAPPLVASRRSENR